MVQTRLRGVPQHRAQMRIKNMKKMTTVLFMMVAMSVSTPAFAGECDSVEKYANNIVGKYQELCKKNCDVKNQKIENVKAMVKFWNDMAGNSWAKIGPRHFEFANTTKGTIQSVGKRTWVSAAPAGSDSVSVTIKKTDGKGSVRYNICTMDPKTKKPVRVGFGEFDKGDGTESQTKTIKGASRKFVFVELVGENVTRSFSYDLTVR